MAGRTTFIKLDRNILNWRWYNDANTFRVFVHLLLKANIKKCGFGGLDIERGQAASSYPELSRALNISIRSVRTAIEQLKTTGELTVSKTPKFTVFTVVNYDLYQAGRQASRQQNDIQATFKRQAADTNQRMEELKNGRSVIGERLTACAQTRPRTHTREIPTLDEVKAFFREQRLKPSADKFFYFYEAKGWQGIYDWKAKAKEWDAVEPSNGREYAAYDLELFEEMLNTKD